jgi:drug/metabolite transporter (DMT)-like permease
LISFLDFYFLQRELPSLRSWLALFAIFGGATLYVLSEHGIPSVAIGWAALWFGTFAIDMVYIKHIVDTLPMKPWGRVYYQNLLALPILLVIFFVSGEYKVVGEPWDFKAIFVVSGSCACGAALCYTGFELRAMVSATTYTVIGIASKVASSLISMLMLSEGASMLGVLGLGVCIVASTFYQQSPKRASSS